MSAFDKLQKSINQKNSILCIGLDSDLKKIPDSFEKSFNGLLEFNKCIIEATSDMAAAYKINFAFYEQYGSDGFDLLKQTFELIPNDVFTIADAKRGDIGNTSAAYSKAVFDFFKADSITVNPYMGFDSIEPFLEDKSNYVFLLVLTSNPGSYDFQRLSSDGKFLYQHVIEKSTSRFTKENLGFVVGGTHAEELAEIRKQAQENCLLIPGVGAQGASISAIRKAIGNSLALINVSRAIIYPQLKGETDKLDFSVEVRKTASNFYKEMKFKQ